MYDNADTKQVVLYLTLEEKEQAEAQFSALGDEMDADTPAEVLLGLIAFYERDHGQAA